MERTKHLDRRRGLLITLSAVLVIAGLVLAVTAPAGPSRSAKADAYGPATPTKPPKTKADCDKLWGTNSQFPDARECRELVGYKAALKKCAKKTTTAKRTACKKAVKAKHTKDKARLARQRKAQAVCTAKQNAAISALDPSQPDFVQKQDAINAAFLACSKRAQALK